MTKYKNTSGNSGVTDFEIGVSYIIVIFKNVRSYKYTYDLTGKSYVDEMKALATDGRGLSGFIGKHRTVLKFV